MLYSTLRNDELARWVAVSPKDHAAKAELLRRAEKIIGHHGDYIDNLEGEVECLHAKVEKLNSQLANYEN